MIARLGRSVSSEWRKVTATKTWWILALVLALYTAMMAASFAFIFQEVAEQAAPGAGGEMDYAHLVYSTTATLGYVVPLVFGALAATNELRHGTLGVTFTIEPRRGVVLAGKTVVLGVVGVILALSGLVGAVAAGAPLLSLGDLPVMLGDGGTWAIFARITIAIALWAIIGFGAGLIVKNQAFAIVLAIGFTQFIEPVARIAAQFWDWSAAIGKFLPGAAMDSFVGVSVLNSVSATDPTMPDAAASLGMGSGLAVLAAYAALACAVGWVLRLKADVS